MVRKPCGWVEGRVYPTYWFQKVDLSGVLKEHNSDTLWIRCLLRISLFSIIVICKMSLRFIKKKKQFHDLVERYKPVNHCGVFLFSGLTVWTVHFIYKLNIVEEPHFRKIPVWRFKYIKLYLQVYSQMTFFILFSQYQKSILTKKTASFNPQNYQNHPHPCMVSFLIIEQRPSTSIEQWQVDTFMA